jgi:hypothetical protein
MTVNLDSQMVIDITQNSVEEWRGNVIKAAVVTVTVCVLYWVTWIWRKASV